MPSKVRRSAWGLSAPKVLFSAAAAALLAGCSADAERLTANPSAADPVYTASVPKSMNAATAGVDDEISSKPITGAAAQPPSYDYSKSYKAQPYRQPAAPAESVIASEAAPEASGNTVTVGPGMTLYSVARANNISVTELAAANGIKPPYSVHTGQTLRIPAAGSAGASRTASAEVFAEPDTAPAPPAKPFKQGPSVADDGTGEAHTVASGETLFSLGRKYGISPFAIAEANGLPRDAQLTSGQRVRIPGGGKATSAKKAPNAPKPAEEEVAEAPAAEAPAASAAETANDTASSETAAPAAEAEAPKQSAAVDGAPGMRWPVRGKVISGFGPKSNGLKNEGINIAVPEGTSIRAAESGIVAYAGNELKGYGNLVLIRHDNGYVTAYAHAKELFVKRGDTVKRGDVIAKAGQTGSVSSPQLHFEVRKGATALDPMKFLSSATAAN